MEYLASGGILAEFNYTSNFPSRLPLSTIFRAVWPRNFTICHIGSGTPDCTTYLPLARARLLFPSLVCILLGNPSRGTHNSTLTPVTLKAVCLQPQSETFDHPWPVRQQWNIAPAVAFWPFASLNHIPSRLAAFGAGAFFGRPCDSSGSCPVATASSVIIPSLPNAPFLQHFISSELISRATPSHKQQPFREIENRALIESGFDHSLY